MIMQFGSFCFPFNPQYIEVSTMKNISTHQTIDGNTILQTRGNKPLKAVCRGQFFGDRAEEYYNKLREMCKSGEIGVLSLPEHKSFYAVCSSIKFIGRGGGRVIEYESSFIEVEREHY